MNQIHNNWGFTVMEILVAVSLVGIISLGASQIITFYGGKQKQLQIRSNASLNRLQLVSSVQNQAAWQKTIDETSNVSMACLRDSTPCATGGSFKLLSASGTVLYDGINSASGFTAQGVACSTYSDTTGNDDCPLHIDLQWQPICTPLPCKPRQAKVTVDIKHNPQSATQKFPWNKANYHLEVFKDVVPPILNCGPITITSKRIFIATETMVISYSLVGGGGGGTAETGFPNSGLAGATVTGSFTADAGNTVTFIPGGGGGGGSQGLDSGAGGAGYMGGGGASYCISGGGGGGGSTAVLNNAALVAFAAGGNGGPTGDYAPDGCLSSSAGGGGSVGGVAGLSRPSGSPEPGSPGIGGSGMSPAGINNVGARGGKLAVGGCPGGPIPGGWAGGGGGYGGGGGGGQYAYYGTDSGGCGGSSGGNGTDGNDTAGGGARGGKGGGTIPSGLGGGGGNSYADPICHMQGCGGGGGRISLTYTAMACDLISDPPAPPTVIPVASGICGPANGTPLTVAPTINACSAGTSSLPVLASFGDWRWSCVKDGGGVTDYCQAPSAFKGTWLDTNGGPGCIDYSCNIQIFQGWACVPKGKMCCYPDGTWPGAHWLCQ